MASAPRTPDVRFLVDGRPVDGAVARSSFVGVPAGRLGPLSQLNRLDRLRALRVDDVWCLVDLSDEWRVAYRLAAQGGAVIVSEVRVYPREAKDLGPGLWRAHYLGSAAPAPPGGLTARLLRQVHVGAHQRVADQVLRQIAGDATLREAFPPYQDVATAHGLDALASAPRRPGRPRRPALFYAQVAARYVEALARGGRGPAHEVARAMGVSDGQARQWLHAARDRGLLTRTPGAERTGQQGQKGGALTPRARTLLKEEPRVRTRTRTRRPGRGGPPPKGPRRPR